jgi:hypothetical protein
MRPLLRWLFLAAATAISAPSFAQVHLDITFGPPAPRSEIVLSPSQPNTVWIPGYYSYDIRERNYVWVPGHYVLPPSQQVTWVAPRYVQRGNHIDYYAGHWDNGKHKGWYKHNKEEAHEKHER